MPSHGPRLAMVAGEASGDLLAGLLLGGLTQRWPALSASGIGGPKMAAQGFEAWWPSDKLAVRGYAEVIRHYPELLGIRNRLAKRLLQEPPDAFIGVDAPDFNLDLEVRLKASGIRTIHFIGPSIWAWRGERIDKIKRAVDHVLCIFPFEPALYAQHGVAATYVGHPLADAIPIEVPRQASRRTLNLNAGDTVVALLPGSRRSEIQYIAPTLLEAAALMKCRRPDLRFVLPVAPGLRALIEPLLSRHAPGVCVELLDGQSHLALAACDVTLIASGTATLEAALFKRPMVIAYKVSPANYRRMKRLQLQPWVGLPNVLTRSFLVPECLQDDCNGAALAKAAQSWLDDPEARQSLQASYVEIQESLRADTARITLDVLTTLSATLGR